MLARVRRNAKATAKETTIAVSGHHARRRERRTAEASTPGAQNSASGEFGVASAGLCDRCRRDGRTHGLDEPTDGHMMQCVKLKIVLEPSDDGGFTAYAPTLPGCISEGDTREDALRNMAEAIELYLEPVDDDLATTDGREIAELVV